MKNLALRLSPGAIQVWDSEGKHLVTIRDTPNASPIPMFLAHCIREDLKKEDFANPDALVPAAWEALQKMREEKTDWTEKQKEIEKLAREARQYILSKVKDKNGSLWIPAFRVSSNSDRYLVARVIWVGSQKPIEDDEDEEFPLLGNAKQERLTNYLMKASDWVYLASLVQKLSNS